MVAIPAEKRVKNFGLLGAGEIVVGRASKILPPRINLQMQANTPNHKKWLLQ
jgi:hypothetical protein